MIRRGVGIITLAFAALALVPVLGTGAQTGPAVVADKDGWWSRLQGEADPVVGPTPLGGVVPTVPPSPTIPEGSLPVVAGGGEPATVAAVGITIDAPQGSTVNRLTMTLALAEGDGAEQNAEGAAILACPITSFWGAADNGKWTDRPEADCEQGAPGTRNEDGSWTFDLTPIGTQWFDQFGTLGQNGVLLVEGVEPPDAFQVAFGRAPAAVTFESDIVAGAAGADPFELGGGGGGFGGGSPSFDAGAPTTFDPEPAPAPPVETPDEVSPPRPTMVADPAGASDVGALTGNLPLGLLVLIPLALVVALAGGRALGPVPAAVTVRRQGGIGRALAARAAARPSRSLPELP